MEEVIKRYEELRRRIILGGETAATLVLATFVHELNQTIKEFMEKQTKPTSNEDLRKF